MFGKDYGMDIDILKSQVKALGRLDMEHEGSINQLKVKIAELARYAEAATGAIEGHDDELLRQNDILVLILKEMGLKYDTDSRLSPRARK